MNSLSETPLPQGQSVPTGQATPEMLRDKYTFSRECCVDGEPNARTVWIKIGNQSFSLDGYQDDEETADWMRLMLGKAFAVMIKHERILS